MSCLTAQYAHMVTIGFGGKLDDLRAKLEVLQGYCQKMNRPYTDIQKMTPVAAPIFKGGALDTATLDYMRSLAAFGIDEVTINYPNNAESFDLLTNAFIPVVKDLATAGQ